MPAPSLADTFPSFQLGKQIFDSLEDAKTALFLEDPEYNKWFPRLAKAKGQGRKEFLQGIVRAMDAARAAYDAGYRDSPIPQACDTLTGLCAYVALMLRDEIMRQILTGEMSGCEGTLALSVLNRFDQNPQSLDNAAWFSALMASRRSA